MSAESWVAGAIGCAAVADDLARRKISNWIPLVALISGFAVHAMQTGWRGAVSTAAGALAGGAVFLLFYLLGGLGGGDIKLMTGFGAVLGTSRVLEAALWTAACGGLIAASVIAAGAIRSWWSKRGDSGEVRAEDSRQRTDSIPYAPAITLGAWLSLISHAPSTQGLV
jgi:Flp pilus assembly protein protease CpaA